MKQRLSIAFVLLGAILLASFAPYIKPEGKKFGIRTIVIDAGHGGKDPGCHGAVHNEKTVALNVALKLGKYIEENFKDVKVVYTRKTDIFVELGERAAIANRAKADLFICIHCNASPNKAAFGSETYVMGLHKTKGNLDVAKRENASILLEDDYKAKYDGFDPNSDEGAIIFTLYQNAYLEQSLNLASKIQHEFKSKAGRVDKGVKQAGFLVLWKTAMPSLLTEIGFLTNPEEEKFLGSDKGQDYIASALFRAFRSYKNEVEGKTVQYDDDFEKQPVYVEEKTEAEKTETLETKKEKTAKAETKETQKSETAKNETPNPKHETAKPEKKETGTPALTDLPVKKEELKRIETGENKKAETPKQETAKSETAKQETVKAETKKEETVKGETVKAETVKAETVKFETAKLETPNPKPETLKPETQKTETVKFETAKLETAKSETQKPETPNPKPETAKSEAELIAEASKKLAAAREEGVFFKVQFASSDKVMSTDNEKFRDIEDVSYYQVNGIYKYTAGNYREQSAAVKLQAELRKRGYTDAFVVAFRDGKRIPVNDANKGVKP